MKTNNEEILFGIALLSPLDEIAAAVITGGGSLPTVPIQGAVSALIGTVFITHGLGIWK